MQPVNLVLKQLACILAGVFNHVELTQLQTYLFALYLAYLIENSLGQGPSHNDCLHRARHSGAIILNEAAKLYGNRIN